VIEINFPPQEKLQHICLVTARCCACPDDCVPSNTTVVSIGTATEVLTVHGDLCLSC